MIPLHQDVKNVIPRTLVVGGAGFLGSHLCDRLIGEGHDVICMDNLLTGRLENIQHLFAHPRFTFVQHDVTKPIALPSAIGKGPGQEGFIKFDYVLHLALQDSPKDYLRHRLQTLKIEALGCYHTLGLAKEHGSVFLLASTPEIVGGSPVDSQEEMHGGPASLRVAGGHEDEAKRFAESIAMAYHREHHVKVRIARISETYGERMQVGEENIVSTFIVRALQGKPLAIPGGGGQRRSLCYVSDVVDGLYRLLLSEEMGPVNLGNLEAVTLRELAETIIVLTGSKSRLVFKPLPADEPMQVRLDILKAKRALKWRPRTGLMEGIKRVIPHFRAQLADRWLHHPEPGWRSPYHGVDERYVQNN